jgi:hypothetical protein
VSVRLLSAFLLVAIASTRSVDGEPVGTRTIRVKFAAEAKSASIAAGSVTLRRLMGAKAPMAQAVVSLSEPVTFMVPERTMWAMSAQLPGWWAAPVALDVQDHDVEVAVPLVPTGIVTGRLVAPVDVARPASLSVVVDVPPGARTLPGPASAESPCSIAGDSRFSCELPIGTLDLSFRPDAHVPFYRWGVKVTPGASTDLGSFTLSEGSAVSGFVTLSRKNLEPGKGKVQLFLDAAGGGATASRLRRPVAQVAPAKNGFFQLTNVPPGRYVLLASYPGFAEAVVSPVQVYEHVEAKLRRPIELQPPAALTLRIHPETDYDGNVWSARVMRASLITNGYDTAPIFEGPATDGAVVLREQPGGRYQVTIADAAGNPFLAEELTTAGAGDETHDFSVEFVKIVGTIQRGENPLAATIWFGGRFGDKHVVVRSDDEGHFTGVLPHSGPWRVTVASAGIDTVVSTKVAKTEDGTPSEVVLEIPSNHVEGIVVDGTGKPLRNALVRLNTDSEFTVARQTDDRGAFAFDGVAPGPFTLTAEAGSASAPQSSAPHAASVGADQSIDGIVLKVRNGRTIRARVVSPSGPVIGADISVYPTNGPENPPQTTATTGFDGTFEATVAEGYDRALMTVQAPGYALRVFDAAVDGRAVTLNVQQAGGTLRITAPEDVNGLVVFQDGRFLSTANLIRWALRRGEPFVDGHTFRVGDVAPARYRVCTMKPGRSSLAAVTRCAEGFLPPYGDLHLTID